MNFIHTYSTKNRTSGIHTSGDRTSGEPPVMILFSAYYLYFIKYSYLFISEL